MACNESVILADMLDKARSLTLLYLKYLEGVDKTQSFTIGDFQTNNIHWIAAHLAWAEDNLILRGIGDQRMDVPWFDHFRLGSEKPSETAYPSWNDTLDVLYRTHRRSLEVLRALPDQALDAQNHINLKFGADGSKRIVVQHCIRHESAHCGHLGWLLRMHGRKLI